MSAGMMTEIQYKIAEAIPDYLDNKVRLAVASGVIYALADAGFVIHRNLAPTRCGLVVIESIDNPTYCDEPTPCGVHEAKGLDVDTYRAAVIAELRRQSKEGLPKDDNKPWRQVNLDLADSLERFPVWPVLPVLSTPGPVGAE